MTLPRAALRRISSITLALAFVAMSTSGISMLLVDRFGFQVRMHPVHNVFGITMVVAGVLHAAFNWKALTTSLRLRWPLLLGVLLAGVMILLFIGGLTRTLDAEAVRKVEEVLSAARQAEHDDS